MGDFAQYFHIMPWDTRRLTVLEFRYFVDRAEQMKKAREAEHAELEAMKRR